MRSNTEELTLVTGAGGMVGNNLVRQLLSGGHRVRALIHSETRSLDGLDTELVQGNVLDSDFLQHVFASVDVVYHTAAKIAFDQGVDVNAMWRVNVDGTANIVAACLNHKVKRLIHFSSIHALSHLPREDPIDETRALAIGGDHLEYDQSKAEAEQIVSDGVERGLDAVSILPTWIFGPYDFRPSGSGEFLLQLMNRQLPALVNAGYFCVDVRDVVQAAIAAESKGQSGHRYILPGHYATFQQLASWTYEQTGIKPPLVCLPRWVASVAAPIVESVCRIVNRTPLMTSGAVEIIRNHQKIETEKAAAEIGYRSRPLKETISDTINWLQKEQLNQEFESTK